MAFESEIRSDYGMSLPAASTRNGLDNSEAARLIPDSLGAQSQEAGNECRRQPDILFRYEGGHDRPEIVTLLVDAEQVVKATERATVELLQTIYLNPGLLSER